MQHTDEIYAVQEAVLKTISAARDSIQQLLESHNVEGDLVDHTLRRMMSYMSDRSQAISFLASTGYVWDAEIVLRTFYEVSAKIWFLCFSETDDREALVNEFWGTLADTHNHKKAHRAKAAAALAAQHGKGLDEAIFQKLTDAEFMGLDDDLNRKRRKEVERRWSFSEIIFFLSDKAPLSPAMKHARSTLHMYGMQSHLVHADESALDLMLDRQLRKSDERLILARSHVTRILLDQASFWLFSNLALTHRYMGQIDSDSDVWRNWREAHTLGAPVQQAFYDSQAAFYNAPDEP